MSARIPDTRKTILFVGLLDSGDLPIQVIRRHLLSVSSPSAQVMSWVEIPGGWQISKAAQQSPEVFSAIRHCATFTLGLESCLGARLGRGPTHLAGVANVTHSMLVWWPASQPGLYQSLEVPGNTRLELRSLFEHDVDTCWVQFLCGSSTAVKQIRVLVPEDPYLPRPVNSVRSAVPSRLTQMSDVDTHMSEDPHVPPPPPYVPAAQRIPVPTGSSWGPSPMSTRQEPNPSLPSEAPPLSRPRSSPVPSYVPPPKLLPEKRPVNSNHKRGPPLKSQAINASSSMASSSWQAPASVPLHVPLLPIDTDDESLAETLILEDEATFAVWESIENSATAPELSHEYLTGQIPNEYIPFGNCGNTCWFMAPVRELIGDEFCVYDVITSTQVIEKACDELTAAEVKANSALVAAAIRKELGSFVTHECFKPIAKGKMRNVLSSRWLFKWKVIDGVRSIKARLVAHGFKDAAAESLITFANTTARWGQRIINSVAAQRQWELLSADVGTAFLQGLTFEELSKLTGEPLREVGFVPPRGYEQFFQELPGLAQFSVVLQDLCMIKPIYGLKDAPRAWRKRLDQILVALKGRALKADSAIYVWHSNGQLCCIASTHVDDLKIAGVKAFVKELLKAMEEILGPLKVQNGFMSMFEHCGIMHEQDASYAVTIHQNHYCSQLRPANVSDIDVTQTLVALTILQVAVYQSLLGALSWLSQTRMDIAIYVQALQRNAKAPLVEHLLRLNKVCKWVKRKPSSIRYGQLIGPVKTLAIADSAFRKEDRTGLAMRGAVIALAEQKAEQPGGRIHAIEYYSRKQRRITRSTYSAELHSLIDAIETAKLVTHAMTEIMTPHPLSPSQLVVMEETGNLIFDIEACIDAKSIYDSLTPSDTKNPTEGSLIFVLLQVKEMLRSGTLRTLWWVDTRDMLADALNKGCVSREALLVACRTGSWVLKHASHAHRELEVQTVASAKDDVLQHMTNPSDRVGQ